MAQPMPSAGEGLGRPEPQGARIPAPRVHPPHAPKAMSNQQMIPDGLLWIADGLGHQTLVSQISTNKLVKLRELRRSMPKMGKEGNPPISGRTCNATFERLKFCHSWLKENGYPVPAIRACSRLNRL